MARWLQRFGTLTGLAAICLAFAVLRPDAFATGANLANVTQQMATLAIIALAATLVLVIGEFDLSVGFVASWAGVCVVTLLGAEFGVPSAIAITLIGCVAVGVVNGALVALFGVPSFIATLALGTVISGVSYWVSGGASLFTGIPRTFTALARMDIGPVPVLTVWMAAVLVVFAFLLAETEFGRRLYAIGGNREAARLSGVPVSRDVIVAFALSAALAGLTGVLLAARLGSVQHTMGDAMLLPAYAAAFLGMTAFREGEANVAGTLLGVAIIAVLANGLTILNVAPFYQRMLTGAIIILAVLLRRAGRIGGRRS